MTFGEQLLQDAESQFIGVDVKFIGGPEGNKYTLTAHRAALCTTAYFRRLFQTGTGDPPVPPQADRQGFFQVTPPPFVNESTMKYFIKWIYTRKCEKELKFDIPLCLSLSISKLNPDH
jgi:hypothetical protein